MLETHTSRSRIGFDCHYDAPARRLLPPINPIHPDLDASRHVETYEFDTGTIVSARPTLPTSPRRQVDDSFPEVIAVVELESGTWICAWITGCTFDACSPATRVAAEPSQGLDGLPVFRLR
ncbi:hypothetical protein [Prescottella agglutinans]|uniref:hypothetical protein n=1 Tax=Prescottella agglutinans TaxID=1644129 RepID=UPI003D99E4E1